MVKVSFFSPKWLATVDWGSWRNWFNVMKLVRFTYVFFLSFFLILSFVFWGPHPWHMEVPRPGLNGRCRCQPTSQPQKRRIQEATSATYTTTHSNAGSSIHRVRLGFEPASSWIIVGFINYWAMTGTPGVHLFWY